MNWDRILLYMLLVLGFTALAGMLYWEILFQTSTGPGRHEYREGLAITIVYTWPIYLLLAGMLVSSLRRFNKLELSLAVLPLVGFVSMLGVMFWL